MKTIKKGSSIKRVSDKEAMEMVRFGWEYCPKNLWKEGRKKKRKPVEGVKTETDNMSDKKKRKMRKEAKRKKYENN